MISKTPLLHILVPLVAGIFFTSLITIPVACSVIMALASMALFFIAHKTILATPSFSIKFAYIPTLFLYLVCFFTGITTATINRPPEIDTSVIENKIISGEIREITDKDLSTRLIVKLCGSNIDSLNITRSINALIYLDHKNFMLKEGDIIIFKSHLARIKNLGNPEEFDYSSYMSHNGILYTQTIKENAYKVIGHSEDIFITSRCLQRKVINLILNSSLQPNTKQLICTAVIGDANFIDDDTRQIFSKAGIAHILAISGLHIGIILAILSLILRPIDFLGIRFLRICISAIAVLFFLFITGMSISAIRATIMSCCIMVAILTHRKSVSINSICLAAIIILSISPYAVYNVGFQLSFTAVTTIILLASRINPVSPRRRIMFKITSYVIATVAANLGCALLSAYYFHTLPLIASLSNLIIIPILPLFISISLLYILALSIGMDLPEIKFILDSFTSLFNNSAQFATNIPGAYIDNMYVTLPMLIFYYATLSFIITFIYQHKFHFLALSLISLIAVVSASTFNRISTPKEGFMILNEHSCTPCLYFKNGEGYLWCTDSPDYAKVFTQRHKSLLAKYAINSLYIVADNNSSCDNMKNTFKLILGKRIAIISSTWFRHLTSAHTIDIDYLIITKRYYGKLSELLNLFSPHNIILSGAIYDNTLSEFIDECSAIDKNNISIHNLSTDGALVITR